MARAVRMYQIIYAGRDGVAPEEVVPPMNEEELKLYKSVKEETEERRAKGLPPYMYEIPFMRMMTKTASRIFILMLSMQKLSKN